MPFVILFDYTDMPQKSQEKTDSCQRKVVMSY